MNTIICLGNLRFSHLEDHVKGMIKYPPKTLLNSNTMNPLYLRWQRHDQTILNWIFSSLSEGIHAQIINSATSFVAWDYVSPLSQEQGSGNIEFNCNPQRKVPFP